MAKTIIAGAQAGGRASTANTTQFWLIGSGINAKTVESQAQILLRSPGTLSNLQVRVTANAVAATSTFTLMKNGAAGNQTVSVGSSATGLFEDTTHTDTIAAGDKIDLKTVPGATTNTYTIALISVHYAATTNTVSRCVSFQNNTVNVSTTNYAMVQSNAITATEANAKSRMRKAGTFKNLCVNVSANTVTNAGTFTMRKNGAAGTVTVSIGASATGFFEDTTHSDSVVAGDDYNNQYVAGTAGTSTVIQSATIDFESVNGDGMYGIGTEAGLGIAINVTDYFALSGSLATATTTEATTQTKFEDAQTFSQLTARVLTNANTGSSTVKFRKNTANGNQSVSIGSGATGLFTDSVNTDVVATGDLVNYQVVTANSGSTFTLAEIKVWATGLARIQSATRTAKYNLVQRITGASRTAKYNLIKRIAGSQKTAKYNLVKKITSSRTAKYNLIKRIAGLTRTVKYNLVKRITGPQKTAKYNLLKKITISKTAKYNLLKKILASRTAKYNLLKKIVSSRTTKYNLIKRITGLTRTAKYNLLLKVTQTRTAKYNLIKRIAGLTRTAKYSLLKKITISKTAKYNLIKRITGLTRTAKYNLLLKVASPTRTTTYNLIKRIVGLQQTAKYSLLKKITISKTVKYNLLQKITGLTRTAKYNLLLKVQSASRTAKYNLLLKVASATRTAKYNILLKVASPTQTAKYNLIARIHSLQQTAVYNMFVQNLFRISSATQTAKYNLLLKVAQSKAAKYNLLLKVASASRTAKYSLLFKVASATRTAKYSLLKQIQSLQRTAKYNLLKKVASATQTAKYNLVARIQSLQQTVKYNLFIPGLERVSSLTQTAKYNLLQKITTSKTSKYNILAKVASATRSTKYNIAIQVQKSGTVAYNLVKRIQSLQRTAKYNLIARIQSDQKTAVYNVYALINRIQSSPQTAVYNIVKRVSKQNKVKYNLINRTKAQILADLPSFFDNFFIKSNLDIPPPPPTTSLKKPVRKSKSTLKLDPPLNIENVVYGIWWDNYHDIHIKTIHILTLTYPVTLGWRYVKYITTLEIHIFVRDRNVPSGKYGESTKMRDIQFAIEKLIANGRTSLRDLLGIETMRVTSIRVTSIRPIVHEGPGPETPSDVFHTIMTVDLQYYMK